MDTIYYNGIIEILDQGETRTSALAVKDGKVAAFGEDAYIKSLASSGTRFVDLDGAFMCPGFVDSHMHLMFYASELSTLDLSKATSFQEVSELCRKALQERKGDGRWILGNGFNENNWEKPFLPNRSHLDEISKDIPIVIRRTCHHISIGNTAALKAMNLLGEQKWKSSFNIGFFPDGAPNGILYELAQNMVTDAQPIPTEDDIENLILLGTAQAAEKGLTQVHTDDFPLIPGEYGETIMNVYKKLARENRLPIRIYQQCNLSTMELLKGFLSAGYRTGQSEGLYRLGPLKLIADGALGARTAALKAPYIDNPLNKGVLNYTDEEMYSLCSAAHRAGMQIAIHAIGDAAAEQVLNTLQKVQFQFPRKDPRHGVVHCQIMSSKQQKRFQDENLLAYVQPIFLRSDTDIIEKCIGEPLRSESYNWKFFKELGVHQSGGSDCPVESFDPLPGIEYAVTRTNPLTRKSFTPENGLSPREALLMFTREGAYASFEENARGSLEVSKAADFVILDKDILSCPPSEISKAKVLKTVVAGKEVYSI